MLHVMTAVYIALLVAGLFLYALVPTLAQRSGRSWLMWSLLTFVLTPLIAGMLLGIFNKLRPVQRATRG